MRTVKPIDDETVGWKITITRNAIAYDWAELAKKGLSFEQRKPIRERLQMNTKALRQLVGPSWSAAHPVNPRARSLGIEAVEKALSASQSRALEPTLFGWRNERKQPPG
jgi:hypothetical protein